MEMHEKKDTAQEELKLKNNQPIGVYIIYDLRKMIK